MFVLSEFKDTVCIYPDDFGEDQTGIIIDNLNRRFSNKVIIDVGLLIKLWDIVEIGPQMIYHSQGTSTAEVRFRFLVFRPFEDEVIVGKLRSCSSEGIHISLNFFSDIFIPAGNLREPSRFDEKEHVWIWQYNDGESLHDMFMDTDEPIRFKVKELIFNDTTPSGPNRPDGTSAPEPGERKVPFAIRASITDDGCGLLSWWQEPQELEEEEEMEEDG